MSVDMVARATILAWDRYLTSQDPDEIRGLVGWLGALRGPESSPYARRPGRPAVP